MVRITPRQKKWLDFLLAGTYLSEAEYIRDLIRKETWAAMQKLADSTAKIYACLDLKLPTSAQSLPVDDIYEMLDEEKGRKFAELWGEYYKADMAKSKRELDYTSHEDAIKDTWDPEEKKTFLSILANKKAREE